MVAKQKSKRNVKKEVSKLFEKSFDLEMLNYKKRSTPLKPKSMLLGLGVACSLYMVGFAIAYIGMNKGILDIEGFAKLVWIMMLPTTIVGLTAWQISKNRMEYPIRQDILTNIANIESNGGLLWKFEPLLDVVGIEDVDTKKAIKLSKENKSDELAVEDYTDAVEKLYQILVNTEARNFSTSIAESVISNFSDSQARTPKLEAVN